MRILLCIAILPCILAAEITYLDCPDGTQCPFGKVCCETSTPDPTELPTYKCCDLPESERENKRLVPGMCSASQRNQSDPSLASGPDDIVQQAPCIGTVCSSTTCCYNLYQATCCRNDKCCPSNFKCCSLGVYNSGPIWCCARSLRCHPSVSGYCVAGAAALFPTITCLVSLFLLVVALKINI